MSQRLVPYVWGRSHTKHQEEQNIKQLEMKLKLVYNKRDDLKEEIVKELVRGETPSREFQIWLDEGKWIENQYDMLKAQTKGSHLLELSTSELGDEIVEHLEAFPFDHGPGMKSQHKTTSKVRRSSSVRTQARDEKNAGAVREYMKMPFKILLCDNLIQQLKNEATVLDAQPKEVNKEMIAKCPITEAAKADPSRVMETAQVHAKEAKHAIATEPFVTSTGIQAAQEDPVSMEVNNKSSSSPSFHEVELLQPSHSLKAKSDVASSENRHVISAEPRLETNKSIQSMVQQIIRSKAKIIGLCGQGGIGKTTILRALIADPKVKRKFDSIIWVTVSKFWSTRKIQDEVARQLLSCPGSSTSRSLSQALKKEKFLLILDDVWQKIDLNEVGIPCSSRGNGCKLIMTTRSVDLCRDMAAEKIQVGSLSAEESWDLFYEQVGESASPDIEPYARGIVNECDGFPLSIIVVGKALSGETDVSEWKLAFRYFLLHKNGSHGFEPLIRQLNFSCERLKFHARKNSRLAGCNLQMCFLYCARFPEDYEISVSSLVEYWIQEGLLTGTLTDAYKNGEDIVAILVDAALLESSKDGAYVRMQGILRDLASSLIATKEEGLAVDGSDPLSSFGSTEHEGNEQYYLFRAGAGLTEPPPEKEWEVAKIVSLEDNDLSCLPAKPNCPKLLKLSLQRNPRLRGLPASFFESMPYLEVLNMSKTRITSLPESILKLQNLKQLHLRDCERLTSLPSEVGKLKRIELLDLHGTVLYELPGAVGELELLKDLKVSFYGPLDQREYSKLPCELISNGILSSLHHLNTLSIVVNSGDQRWNDITESVIKDMGKLSNLTSLRFYFPELRHLQLFRETNNSWINNSLEKFSFIVGYDNKRMLSRVPCDVELDYNEHDQCLRLVNEKMPPQEAIKQVLARTKSFYLDHHLKISSLSQFGDENITWLEFCVIRECPEIEYIIISGKEVALPLLENLSLHYLGKIKGIWNWKHQLAYGSFASLKCLSVHTCPQLEFVFTSSMCRCVPNLEKLAVEDCEAMKNVIAESKPDDIILRKLKSLRLSYLPNLVSIWKGRWPSLEHLSFYCCPMLKNLNAGRDSELKSSIKEVKAEKEWWNLLERGDDMSLHSIVSSEICKWM